jgi:tetratricopeptide (TPR) repeat protein
MKVMGLLVRVLRIWICGALLASSSGFAQSPPAVQNDPRVGKKILIIRAGAEMRTPKATVWKSYLGEVFTITLTNGEWLWIDEKGGWLWEKEALLLDTAIDEMNRRVAIAATPENMHLRGIACLAHHQYDKAIADFTSCLQKTPRNAGALNNRGQAQYLKGEYPAAIQDFSAAITVDPKNFLAINNRALAYIELEQYPQALSDLQSALQLVPEYPEALNNRGIVHQKLGKVDEAIADFSAALKIDQKYVDALGNRAFSYQQKKEFKKSVADLELAIKISPATFEAINDLSWQLSTCSDDSIRNGPKALDLAKQACGIAGYDQWNLLDTLAAAHAECGQFPEAQQWLSAAIATAPEKEKPRLQKHLDLVTAQMPIRE